MFGEWIWVPLIVGAVVSAASTAYGIVSSQQAAQQQAEMQRKQAELQAANLEQQAAQEEQDQIQRSMVERRQAMRKVAAAEAGYAASGVTLAGTPTLSLASMSEELELETQMEEAASGYKRSLLLTQAQNTRNFGLAGADMTESAGITNSIGLGLQGAANLTEIGYKASKEDKSSDKK